MKTARTTNAQKTARRLPNTWKHVTPGQNERSSEMTNLPFLCCHMVYSRYGAKMNVLLIENDFQHIALKVTLGNKQRKSAVKPLVRKIPYDACPSTMLRSGIAAHFSRRLSVR
jgi:hypothetical protein